MQTLGKIIFSIAVAISSLFGYHQLVQTPVQGSFTPVEGTQFTVAQTILPTDTTITLTSFGTPDGRVFTMSNFGSIGYLTLDPTNTSRLETVTFTGITNNVTSVTLTGVSRGIDFISPYTASSTLARTHLVGSQAILSNPAAFYGQQFALLNTPSTFNAVQTFSSTTPPQYDSPYNASGNQFVSFGQINSIAFTGGATSTESGQGFVELNNFGTIGTSQASSTSGSPLVIQNKFATTTPGTLCSTIMNCIPVGNSSGKISQSWLDLTQAFNFTGASTTVKNLLASSTVNNPIVLNGLTYNTPSTRAASSTTLMEDGNGDLTFQVPTTVYSSYNAGTSVSSGTFATSTLITIPAGVMTASSTIEIAGSASCTATNGNACTLFLRNPNGTTFGSFSMNTPSTASNTQPSGSFSMVVLPNPNTSGQQTTYACSIVGIDTSGGGSTYALKGCQGGGSAGTSSFNLTTGFTLDLVMQAQSSVSGTDSGITVIIHR